jgi:hypothetical protein
MLAPLKYPFHFCFEAITFGRAGRVSDRSKSANSGSGHSRLAILLVPLTLPTAKRSRGKTPHRSQMDFVGSFNKSRGKMNFVF